LITGIEIPAKLSIAREKLHIPYTMIQRLSPIIISKIQVGKQENIRQRKTGIPKILLMVKPGYTSRISAEEGNNPITPYSLTTT